MTVIRRRTDPSINDQQDAAAGALSSTVPKRPQRDFNQPTHRGNSDPAAADQRQRREPL